jgi:hypothetical protein
MKSRKRLVAPAGFDGDGTAYGIIWPGEVISSPNVRRLIAWLQQQFADLNIEAATDDDRIGYATGRLNKGRAVA